MKLILILVISFSFLKSTCLSVNISEIMNWWPYVEIIKPVLSDKPNKYTENLNKNNSEYIFDIIKSTVNKFIMMFLDLIIKYGSQVVILAVITVIIIWYVYKMIKGRHSSHKLNQTKSNTCSSSSQNTTSNINIFNPVQVQERNNQSELRNSGYGLSKPKEYINNMDSELWLEDMETYLEQYDREYWGRIALSFISEKVKKELKNTKEIRKSKDGYNILKNQLLNKSKNKADKELKELDLVSFTNRQQRFNESIEKYGEDLMTMAQQVFKGRLDDYEDLIKTQFLQGLNSEKIREMVKWQIRMRAIEKNKKYSIRDVIDIAIGGEETLKQDKQQLQWPHTDSSSSEVFAIQQITHQDRNYNMNNQRNQQYYGNNNQQRNFQRDSYGPRQYQNNNRSKSRGSQRNNHNYNGYNQNNMQHFNGYTQANQYQNQQNPNYQQQVFNQQPNNIVQSYPYQIMDPYQQMDNNHNRDPFMHQTPKMDQQQTEHVNKHNQETTNSDTKQAPISGRPVPSI